MTEGPTISVVTATHNRAELLPRLVAALEAQDIDAPFEVVIVDDASNDDTWPVLQALAKTSPLTIRPIRLDSNAGPATARNTGWRAASTDRIAFTDDDCVPQVGWLRSLDTALNEHDLVQGMTVPDPDAEHLLGPFSHTITVVAENGHYETCNMGYRRAVLERLDGFDETFRYPMGEDVDLALRAKASGAASTFAPDAVVHHDVSESSFRQFLKLRRKREGFALACKHHRELRGELTLGVFTHLTAVILAIAAAAAIARPRTRVIQLVVLVLLVKYSRQTAQQTRPPVRAAGWLYAIPLHFVADLYEVAVMARASIRHRTLVL